MFVSTLGYAAPGSDRELARLMDAPHTLLIDIRYMPVSRWRPDWRKGNLSARFGGRYIHMRGLGNVNYKDREKGIHLYAPDVPLFQLRRLMESGYSLVLLCACRDYEHCHRRLVYELLCAGWQV